jgi:hypothetical protein
VIFGIGASASKVQYNGLASIESGGSLHFGISTRLWAGLWSRAAVRPRLADRPLYATATARPRLDPHGAMAASDAVLRLVQAALSVAPATTSRAGKISAREGACWRRLTRLRYGLIEAYTVRRSGRRSNCPNWSFWPIDDT